MDPKDIQDSSEPIFENFDIPCVFVEAGNFGIEWEGWCGEGLEPRLSQGLELSAESYKACYQTIEELKSRYYPNGYNGQDVWLENNNGTFSLKTLAPNAMKGTYMSVFSHIGDSGNLDSEMRRIYLHNIDHVEDLLFLAESLVTYLRYLRINVPGIYSKVDRDTGNLLYFFEAPCVENSESDLLNGLDFMYGIKAEMQGNKVLVGEDVILKKEKGDSDDFIWVGEKLESIEAIKLFHAIVKCNRFVIDSLGESNGIG